MTETENFKEFEQNVKKALEYEGWQVTAPPDNNQGHELEAVKGNTRAAVQVKNYKKAATVAHLQQFIDFLDLSMAGRFNQAHLISASGFSTSAVALAEQRNDPRLRLGTLRKGKLNWLGIEESESLFEQPVNVARTDGKTYVGVFTCKGGVGKTTVSAHLAGAFALTGYDVALLDLDPQKNLNTLLPEGVFLKATKSRPGNTISVFSHGEWEPAQSQEKIIICDCSPEFERNPLETMKKLNYCIIPTTLNPLGVNKNGHVIISTVEKIRSVNPTARLFVLINNYFDDDAQRSNVLKREYKRIFESLERKDSKFTFIDPDECSIKNSKSLFYWGYHLYTGGLGELAFSPVGGKCLPKENFLRLVSYLEEHTTIEEQKGDILELFQAAV
jgi:chromosome partitioning protein